MITVNNNGSNSTACCMNGTSCLCNSFFDALYYIENNTTINITSESVLMDGAAYIKLVSNITITGNGVMVMCNNEGSVTWNSGNNIHIEGITWDQCGNSIYPISPAILFDNILNISIINCIFQHSKVCRTIYLIPAEESVSLHVINSNFMFNRVENLSVCSGSHGSGITIKDDHYKHTKSAEIIISQSMFQSNGKPDQPKRNETFIDVVLYSFLYFPQKLNISIEHSTFSSNAILGLFLYDNASSTNIVFDNVTVFNNSQGGVKIVSASSGTMLNITSSNFIENSNGALMLDMHENMLLNFKNNGFLKNKGPVDSQGVALYVKANTNSVINLFHCNFDHNIANSGDSIVYITSKGPYNKSLGLDVIISVNSSSFVNNELGSALHISQVKLKFCNFTLFQNNSAETGAAIYVEQNALITMCDYHESLVQFLDNTALLRGGAIYSDLSNCFNNGVLFSNLSNFNSVQFINNTAKISGNSIYFNIAKSCNIERDYTKNDSVAYIPHKFKYTQSHNTIGPAIGASPYRINLCLSHKCSFTNENCLITGKKMLGQSVYFNATVCDYFDAVAEAVQFQVKCINCYTKYKLLNNELLVNSRSPDKVSVLAMDAHNDVVNDTIITFELSSVLSDNYRDFSARLSLVLSTCYNGFLFRTVSQKCDCYNSGSDDIVQCQKDHAEIKLGYWYGIIYNKHTTSVCPIGYCDFNHRTETRSNYYTLPKVGDDQCNLHRTGVVCSDCKSGYTLAYDSFDCVNVNKCSLEMTVLVIALTFLYWIIIVTVLFGLTYYFSSQVSSGYFNGVIYFYSIVDILLISNLYIIDGLFYTVAILSSFAKLTPQFLGKLCIVKGLDTIDQQFIHYSHVVCVSIILIGIVIITNCFKKMTLNIYVNRCIARVTVLFLLLSYTSVTSTSLQLLRGIRYDNIDGVFVYLSPHLKYFTHQHAVYASVALLCGLTIVVGLPLLLIVEPFVRNNVIVKKFRPILHQFQDSYKEKYHWCAANYLLCRLVIMLMAYFGNSDYNHMVYYIQTACVIIVMNHVFFQPYKKYLLNALDAAILSTMLLVVNLNNFDFSKSTTAGLIYTLLFIPLLLLFGIGSTKLFMSFKMKFRNLNDTQDTFQR